MPKTQDEPKIRTHFIYSHTMEKDCKNNRKKAIILPLWFGLFLELTSCNSSNTCYDLVWCSSEKKGILSWDAQNTSSWVLVSSPSFTATSADGNPRLRLVCFPRNRKNTLIQKFLLSGLHKETISWKYRTGSVFLLSVKRDTVCRRWHFSALAISNRVPTQPHW